MNQKKTVKYRRSCSEKELIEALRDTTLKSDILAGGTFNMHPALLLLAFPDEEITLSLEEFYDQGRTILRDVCNVGLDAHWIAYKAVLLARAGLLSIEEVDLPSAEEESASINAERVT